MKKFLLIFACLIYSINTFGQEGPTTREVMQLTLPKGTEKLDEEKLNNLSHNRFNEKTTSDFHDHIFKKDSLLIYYMNLSFPRILRKSLESNQIMMVSLLGQAKDTVDYSKIISVNNIRFLIIEYHDKNTMYIRFRSDYDKSGSLINGFIECKKRHERQARHYLQDLLKGMHFKNE